MDKKSVKEVIALDPEKYAGTVRIGLTPDGSRLAVVSRSSGGGVVRLLEMASLRCIDSWTFDGYLPRNSPVAFSTDGNLVAVAVNERSSSDEKYQSAILIFDSNSAGVPITISLPEELKPIQLTFLADRNHIAFASGYNVYIWDLRTHREIYAITAHDKHVTALAVTQDGNRIITAGFDGKLRVWDAMYYDLLLTITVPSSETVTRLTVSGDSRTIAATTSSGKVHVWCPYPPGDR
jgi:WD40 repeat protein